MNGIWCDLVCQEAYTNKQSSLPRAFLLTAARHCCIVLSRNVFRLITTMQDDPQQTVRRAAALAGIPIAEERVPALAMALPFVQAGGGPLAAVHYAAAEPAGR